MNKIKVSVLVPVYNVEAYLSQCLNSLIKQKLEEIEIICINDGSTDSSCDIVKEFAAKDNRIVLVDKKNTGYGDSMNIGLKAACGEYVGIVEPDDFVDKEAFLRLYAIANENYCDVVKANFYEYYTDKKKDVAVSNLFLEDEVDVVIDPRVKRHIFFQQPCIWSAIYKKEFLKKNSIKFLPSPGASYQDIGFNFKVWATASRVYYIKQAFLHYRQDNPNSSVKSTGKVEAVEKEYDEIERYLTERGLMEDFGGTLAVLRLAGYVWDMRRLDKETANKMVEKIEHNYSKYKSEGYLDRERIGDEEGYYIASHLAVRNPRLYLKIRGIYEGKNSFLRYMKRTITGLSQR